MKKLAFLLLLPILLIIACDDNPIDPVQNELKFISLTAVDTVLAIDEFTTINAVAEGDELVYTWQCDLGTFIGSGNQVMWAGCHADTFEIKCTVTDKYKKSKSKSVFCYVF